MKLEDLKPNKILRGPLFPEPVQVIVIVPMGASVKLIGKGQNTKTVYEPILTADQLALLETTPVRFIEVKGRAVTGEIALTSNEFNTAKHELPPRVVSLKELREKAVKEGDIPLYEIS